MRRIKYTRLCSIKQFSAGLLSSVFMFVFISSHNAHAVLIDVIRNGSFERGDFAYWSEPPSNPNPWAPVSGKSHTGTFSAYNPVASTGATWPTLYQSFAPTLVDDIVAANFWYFDEGSSGTVGIATLLTFSDGTWVQDTLFVGDPSYIQNQWAFRDLKPTLNTYSGKYLVEIGFFPERSYNRYIDDVSILIPEPTTLLLVGFGTVMMRRRK